MQNELKGLIAGFAATLAITVVLLINNAMNLIPQIDIIGLLVKMASLTRAAAWMDHFIVGVVVWGLAFAAYDGLAPGLANWLKGLIFRVFAWLMMMVTFLPLAGAGFFGAKIGMTPVLGLLFLHLVYGVVLGVTYGLLGLWVPVKVAVILPKEQQMVVAGPIQIR